MLGSRLCPVCQVRELQGERKTCSPACRRKLSRQRQAELRARASQHLRTVKGE